MIGRADRVLTWKRARFWALLLCALYVGAYAWALRGARPPLNSSGVPLGGDYIAFHAAGRLVLTGHSAQLYDRGQIAAIQAELLDGLTSNFYDAFRNPPFAALPFVPLAGLDLVPGFLGWTVLSLACLGLAVWLLLQELPALRPRWRGLLVLVFAFAPVYFGIIDGENATLSLLLYVLVYRALRRDQPSQAGVWAALGLFKPQLFVVLPLVFVAGRRWRALASYALTGLVLLVVSLALVGPSGMQAWLNILVEPEAGNATVNAWRMASLKSFFDLLLPGFSSVATGLYLATSVLLLAGLGVVWAARGVEARLAWIFTSLVAVLVDPHLVDYDLSVLVAAGVLVGAGSPLRWTIVLLYISTLFRLALPVGSGGLLITPLVLCWQLGLVWRLIRKQRAGVIESTPLRTELRVAG